MIYLEWIAAAAAALGGYLLGSVSFSRIVARAFSPEGKLRPFEYRIPGSDELFTSDTVSATAVRAQLGPRYGCITSLLDMAKVAVPALLLRLLLPGTPCFAVAAAAGVIGHNWPLWHRFKGGRGASPIMGGLLVVDPLGLPAVILGGAAAGLFIGHMLIFRWAWLLLMLPWLWFRTHAWELLAYGLVCNAAYWIALLPELRKYAGLKTRPSQEQMSTFFTMGPRIGRWMDRCSLLALLRRRPGGPVRQ